MKHPLPTSYTQPNMPRGNPRGNMQHQIRRKFFGNVKCTYANVTNCGSKYAPARGGYRGKYPRRHVYKPRTSSEGAGQTQYEPVQQDKHFKFAKPIFPSNGDVQNFNQVQPPQSEEEWEDDASGTWAKSPYGPLKSSSIDCG